MNTEKKIQLKFEASWLSNKIIYFKYFDNVVIDLNDVKKMLELQIEMGVNESVKRIVHAGRHTTITSEAREYVEQNKPKVTAEAFILYGLHQKILFDFYYKVRKHKNPLKSFNKLSSAIKWIERF